MIIITDLDGTLAHAAWRANLMHDWDAYHAASIADKPNQPMIDFINRLGALGHVVCITARPERWRQLTNDWLLRNAVQLSYLSMRPNDDRRPSPLVKIDLALALLKQLDASAVIAIDDRSDVVAAYAAQGWVALQAQEV
jgi:hypothetical protein